MKQYPTVFTFIKCEILAFQKVGQGDVALHLFVLRVWKLNLGAARRSWGI